LKLQMLQKPFEHLTLLRKLLNQKKLWNLKCCENFSNTETLREKTGENKKLFTILASHPQKHHLLYFCLFVISN
jgi:hypothetical protein